MRYCLLRQCVLSARVEIGRMGNLREKKNEKESVRNYVVGKVILNCSFV